MKPTLEESKDQSPEEKPRRRSLGELLRDPFTLYPFIFACLCLVALPALRGYGPALVIAGLLLSALGLVYNILFDRLVPIEETAGKKIPPASQTVLPAGKLQGPALRRALERAGHADDLVELHDRFELISHEVRSALNRPETPPGVRNLFAPILRENDLTAGALFNQLVYTQEHLSRLVDEGIRHGEMFEARISLLRDQRARMTAHLDELICLLEEISVEIPRLSGEAFDEPRRRLQHLEEALEKARKTQQSIEDSPRTQE